MKYSSVYYSKENWGDKVYCDTGMNVHSVHITALVWACLMVVHAVCKFSCCS